MKYVFGLFYLCLLSYLSLLSTFTPVECLAILTAAGFFFVILK